MDHVLSAVEQDALRRLVTNGTLSAEQADAVRAALEEAGEPAPLSRGWLVEAAGYVGGAFMLVGATLLVGASWDELSRLGRFLVLLAATVLLAAAGILSGGGLSSLRALRQAERPPNTARYRIASVLLALAAGTGALAAGVTVADHGPLVGGSIGLVLAALGYLLLPSLPLLVAVAALSAFTAVSIVDDLVGVTPLRIGVALILVGIGWVGLGLRGALTHRSGALVAGAIIALFGAQQPVADKAMAWGYVLTLLVALGCFALYAVDHSLLLLIAGVIGVTLAATEAITDWTSGAVGAAALVMIAGAVLLTASGLALRSHHRI